MYLIRSKTVDEVKLSIEPLALSTETEKAIAFSISPTLGRFFIIKI